MKQMKKLFLTSAMLLMVLVGIIYSSCTKTPTDPCSGVNCLNSGVCDKGVCICPTGYTGTYCQTQSTTTLIYQNNTFTPISITVNGSSAIIPVGGTASFTGLPGSSASGSASTSGATTSGTQVGLRLTWNINDVFPTSSSQTTYLNVSSSYFFLKIVNTSSVNITQVYVNYGLTSQTYDNVIVYNTGLTYNIGYYDAWTNSNLYLTAGSLYWSYNIYLSFTQNQSYTFNAS